MLRKSTINSLTSGFFEEGGGITQASAGEKNVALSFILSLQAFSWNFMLLCERIVLVARFPPVSSNFGACNFDIREDAKKKNTTDPCNFLWSNFCTLFDVSFLKDFLTWNEGLWKVFFRQSVSASLEQGKTTVFIVQDYFSTRTPSNCFPLITFSHSPLYAVILHILTVDQYSCLHPCIPGSRVARPDHLTKKSSYHYRQYFIDWHCSISLSFVVIHCWYGLQLDSRILILYNISRTFSLGTSLADSRAWCHLVSKSWVSSPCKDTLNRSDRSRAASWAPVVGTLGRALLTRHGRFHRNLQLSPCLLKSFLELSIYRINEVDASQVSRIVEPSVHR